jgi:hypothetical protein
MTMWVNGISLTSPPPLGLYWMPDFRLAAKRRKQKVVQALLDEMGRWKQKNKAQIEAVNHAWSPIVRDGILPRLPSGMKLDLPEFVAIRAMEGSVLTVARRRTANSPNDPLADTVAAMHYGATNHNTQYPLTNVFASWLFAVAYWAYHHADPSAAVNRALVLLDDPNLSSTIERLVSEERFRASA